MRALADRANVVCKLSGLVTEPGLTSRIGEIAAILIDAFGADRLIWGSDWPVLTLAEDYAPWLAQAQALIAPSARDAVFGGNARRVYALSGASPS
jgi:L-fuconolactonase